MPREASSVYGVNTLRTRTGRLPLPQQTGHWSLGSCHWIDCRVARHSPPLRVRIGPAAFVFRSQSLEPLTRTGLYSLFGYAMLEEIDGMQLARECGSVAFLKSLVRRYGSTIQSGKWKRI